MMSEGTPVTIRSNSEPERVVELTDAAVAKIAELRDQEDEENLALRLAVRPGGCSGFSYEMYFDGEIAEGDTVEEFDQNVRVVVDAQSLEMVRGATIDYKDGLSGAGFAIDNPNVTRSCGCGNSFS